MPGRRSARSRVRQLALPCTDHLDFHPRVVVASFGRTTTPPLKRSTSDFVFENGTEDLRRGSPDQLLYLRLHVS